MEDSSKDLPKPPRITAARPFFSPRPSSGEGVTGPLELSRRRGAQLFTPPSSSLASEPTAKPESSPVSDAEVDFEGDWTASPMITPERTLDAESLLREGDTAEDDRLVVEMYEHEEIELTAAASSVADEHSIEVIAYDDANSLLRAAAHEGKHPKVDGLQLETTEFSFEQEPPPPRMNVDSFWASEPFASTDAPQVNAEAAGEADETEPRIDAETASDSASEAELDAAVPSEAEVERAAEAPAPTFADIAPPWRNRLTPVSSQVLQAIQESEPWELAPPRGFESDPEEIEASAPAAESWSAEVASPIMELSVVEPSDAEPSVVEASATEPSGDHIADALVRIAARVRNGELEVPPCAEMSDEAVLSVVLTSLLRMRH